MTGVYGKGMKCLAFFQCNRSADRLRWWIRSGSGDPRGDWMSPGAGDHLDFAPAGVF